jgi:hypothetical protein
MRTDNENYRNWARLGASQRLAALDAERAAILRAFPGIQSVSPDASGRPRRKFSADARRRMSAGMRKYWAERKARVATKKLG